MYQEEKETNYDGRHTYISNLETNDKQSSQFPRLQRGDHNAKQTHKNGQRIEQNTNKVPQRAATRPP